jgi:hypothetical protein
MVEVSVSCGVCGKPVRSGDEFCEACGGKVSPELKKALQDRFEASHIDFAGRGKSAQSTIGGLSVLFTLGGVVIFFVTKNKSDDALAKLTGADDAEVLEQSVAGATTVGELRGELEREPYQALGLNLFLALVMLGLWMWSKRSLLPAIITALGIYVTVIVASALYDPKSLVQGVIVKVVVIVVLAKGVRAALAARKLELAR